MTVALAVVLVVVRRPVAATAQAGRNPLPVGGRLQQSWRLASVVLAAAAEMVGLAVAALPAAAVAAFSAAVAAPSALTAALPPAVA